MEYYVSLHIDRLKELFLRRFWEVIEGKAIENGPPRLVATEKRGDRRGRGGDRLGYFAMGERGDRSLRSIIEVNIAKVVNNFGPQNGHDRYGVWF